jgi:hypothetical protein
MTEPVTRVYSSQVQ